MGDFAITQNGKRDERARLADSAISLAPVGPSVHRRLPSTRKAAVLGISQDRRLAQQGAKYVVRYEAPAPVSTRADARGGITGRLTKSRVLKPRTAPASRAD